MATQEETATQDETAESRLNSERPSQLSTPKLSRWCHDPLFYEPSADCQSLDSCTLSLFLKSLADFRFPRTIPLTHFAAA